MGVSDNTKGLILAIVSSLFIGASFIFKKKGLRRAAAAGTRAGVGGYTYLFEPLWWVGMITMIVGEIANFVAYIFAPAVLVTPLGALSIIISAVLAHFMLSERLRRMGILGCVSCIVGSVEIIVHAPQERIPSSVHEVWNLATQPEFLIYVIATLSVVFVLMLHFEPLYGQTNVLVYLGICSLMGALTALDTFNAAIVSPIYYVMFTTLTIVASTIMFKEWSGQNVSSITSEICGFITVISGTIILHTTRDEESPATTGSRSMTWYNEDTSRSLEATHLLTLTTSD
ncbi:probable magnesium transporter NIPA6 isoform X2 [Andrographis paniculata]|uniref:probable magnesium transporter NIPA6 isoform X2 n=1 Tax=Andrographis paniculata TaxID=175694 RepID=UPI0021E8CB47|nr:probable magnesium transporter NIPA6 isoform X2 [Andrographis paniculata]